MNEIVSLYFRNIQNIDIQIKKKNNNLINIAHGIHFFLLWIIPHKILAKQMFYIYILWNCTRLSCNNYIFRYRKQKVDTTGTALKTNRKIIETETRSQTQNFMTTHSLDLSQTLPCHMLMECCVFKMKWNTKIPHCRSISNTQQKKS